MGLGRYAVLDAYTLEELRREYARADAKRRISLLKKLNRQSGIPSEIAGLAVKDPGVDVREWIARHGKYLFKELEEYLKNDPDPFVRADRKSVV